MGKKILFLDALPFDARIQVGSQRYARLFRKAGYDVFSLANYLHFLRFLRGRPEDRESIEGYRRGIQVSPEGISFYSPLCLLPYINFPGLDSMVLARNCLRFCLPRLGKMLTNFKDIDILFVNNVRLMSVLKIVKAKTVVLRITDRFVAFPNVPSSISRLENEALKLADLVFATSRDLRHEASRINPNCHYLPNGVEAGFIKRGEITLDRPDEYMALTKPIALYVGAVSDWFDYETYEFGLERLRDVCFVLIGPVGGHNYQKNSGIIRRFSKKYANFFYLGPKNFSELKPYFKYADVGLIPFQLNSLSHDINPVKLYEYASWGLPTVASDMREMQHYQDLALLYTSPDEYVDLIGRAIREKNMRADQLIAAAKENTWEIRFDFLLSKLHELGR